MLMSSRSALPVLEVFDERRALFLERHRGLRDKVYIPAQGVGAGDDGRFIVSETNKAFDLKDRVRRFLRSDQEQVLLLSGAAGSGKSTAVAEIELMVETEFRDGWRHANDRGAKESDGTEAN